MHVLQIYPHPALDQVCVLFTRVHYSTLLWAVLLVMTQWNLSTEAKCAHQYCMTLALFCYTKDEGNNDYSYSYKP